MAKLGMVGIVLAVALVAPAVAREPRDASSDDVRRAQQTLDDLGYRPGTADGRVGDRTRTAIRNFQRDKGLNATGRLDDDTLDALDTASRREDHRERAEDTDATGTAAHGAAARLDRATIRAAQTKLDRLGYPVAHADGSMGAETRTAIRNFQRDRGLNATGELDDETRAALRSETGTATRSRTR